MQELHNFVKMRICK